MKNDILKSDRVRNLTFLTLLALAITVPFVTKAFHIDDTFYLEITKAIVKDPLRPFSFFINWYDTLDPGFISLHPPFYSYVLAPFYYFFGPSEVMLHLVSVFFVVVALHSFYFICEEKEIPPLYPSLIFLTVPVFAAGMNIMIDVPLISLSLLSLYLFLRGCRRGSLIYILLSGSVFGIALLTKYSALALFAPLVLYALLSHRKKALLSPLIGLLFFVGWNVYSYHIYGKIHFMANSSGSSKLYRIFFLHPLSFLMIVGLVSPYLILFVRQNLVFYISLIFGILTAVAYIVIKKDPVFIFNGLVVGFGIFLGVHLFVLLFKKMAQLVHEERPFVVSMAFWIFTVLCINIVFTPFVAVRNVVYIVPAILFVIFLKNPILPAVRWKWNLIILFMFLISVSVGYADYRYASTYQKAAERLSKTHEGKEIWYIGHWGWQFYAEKEGFDQFPSADKLVQRGDIVVIPQNVHKQKVPLSFVSRLHQISTHEYCLNWFPVRSHGDLSGAGFYATEIYRPPYSFSFAPLEIFNIYEVGKAPWFF